jgi:hypothetical protein
LFWFIGAGMKSSLDFPPTGEIETVPPGARVLPLRPKLLTVPRRLRKEQNAIYSMPIPLSF